MTLTFGNTPVFLMLIAVPVLILLFVLAATKSSRLLSHMVASRLKQQLLKRVYPGRRILKFSLACLAFVFAVVALALPRYGEEEVETKWEGLDVLFVVDISRSMLADDVKPNRLERAKLTGQDIADSLDGDRIGLVAFEGVAELRCPLTINSNEFVKSLQSIKAGTAQLGGTNIGKAIELGLDAFTESEGSHRAMVIITDGEELDADALEFARQANELGVRIFTIGIGSVEGTQITVTDELGRKLVVRGPDGKPVTTKLDEKRLQEIAEITNGIYLPYKGLGTVQKLIRDGLEKMKPQKLESETEIVPIEQYQWPLGIGVILLLISILIPDRPLGDDRRRAPVFRQRGSAAGIWVLLALGGSLLVPRDACARTDASEAYASGNYELAMELYEEQLEEHPNSAHRTKVAYGAGAAAYKTGNFSKATKHFGLALTDSDQSLRSRARYNLGNTFYRQGQASEDVKEKIRIWRNAIEQYQSAVDLGLQKAEKNLNFVQAKVDELEPPKEEQQPEPEKKDQQQQKDDKQSDDQQSEENKDDPQQKSDADSIAKDLQEQINKDMQEHVDEQEKEDPDQNTEQQQDEDLLDDIEKNVDEKLDELDQEQKPEPSGEEKSQPGEEKSQPGEEKSQPGEEKSQSGEEKSQPGEEKSQPGEEKSQPGEEKAQPGEPSGEPSELDQANQEAKMDELRDLLDQKLDKMKEQQADGKSSQSKPGSEQANADDEEMKNIDESVRDNLKEMVQDRLAKNGEKQEPEKSEQQADSGEKGEQDDSRKSEQANNQEQDGKPSEGEGENKNSDPKESKSEETPEGKLASASEGNQGADQQPAQPMQLEEPKMTKEQALQLLRQLMQKEVEWNYQRRQRSSRRLKDW